MKIIITLSVLLLLGCSSKEEWNLSESKPIIGTWESEKEILTFNKDGIVTTIVKEDGFTEKLPFKTYNGNKIVVDQRSLHPHIVGYKIDGNYLIIEKYDKSKIRFKKKE